MNSDKESLNKELARKLKKLFYFLIFWLVAVGILCKYVIRPMYYDINYLSIFLGSLPNFLGAMGYSLFMYLKALNYSKSKSRIVIIINSIIVFIILVREEYVPFFSGSKVTDMNDIIATALGCIAAMIFNELTQNYKLNKLNKVSL